MILEDVAQEALLCPLVHRIAVDEGVALRPRVMAARGGIGKVLGQLAELGRACAEGCVAVPDGVLVCVDANCRGFVERRKAVVAKAGVLEDRLIVAIPDPHIERWYLLDAHAFKNVVGQGCKAPDDKCLKDRYKTLLIEAVENAGVEPLLGGIEHAGELAKAIDVAKIARSDASFGHFRDALRGWLKRFKHGI